MKTAIIYPPIKKNNEYPLLTQNRQFKFSNSLEVRIYPVVMSYLATMLKEKGHSVLFLDGINMRLSFQKFHDLLDDFKPEVIVLESKAPLMKLLWNYIKEVRTRYPDSKIILTGDHTSCYPEESFKNCPADYIIKGGHYDFIITELMECLGKKSKRLPPDVYYKKKNKLLFSGTGKEYDLDRLPLIDRDLTKWDIYGEAYLYHPVGYIMSGRGCGGSNSFKNFRSSKLRKGKYTTKMPGLCSFCVWQYALWKVSAHLMSPVKVVDEIENLVKNYKVKEIFDDNESGGIWNTEWLKDLYKEMKKRNLLEKVILSANARADSLTDEVCRLLKKLNFRLLKIGVESGNDKTLSILKKDETVEEIKEGIKRAKRYGLIAMLTTMVGYPWEDEKQAQKTYEVTKEIMLYKTHFGDSLQSSIIVPYPGTPLYNDAIRKKWFIVDPKDYEKFDMAHQILKTPIDTAKWCKKIWRIHLHPLFLLKSFFSLRKGQDIILAIRGLISLLGHLRDYEK
ncbi:MAG: B12-binding domain-containing radical SAM protein [Spirochaetes bacterium]|nr:B12-binding domain-containing radical SAM protein [Spirochaetota bacterium]